MDAMIAEMTRRWQRIFSTLQRGDDVAPGLRLRTEGMMEAALLVEAASTDELSARMAACYREAFGCSLEQVYGPDWRELFPFPQIPAMAKRAPVYPRTRD